MDELDEVAAANFLGVSVSTLRALVRAGLIEVVSTDPIRITKNQLLRYLEDLRNRDENKVKPEEKAIRRQILELIETLRRELRIDMGYGSSFGS